MNSKLFTLFLSSIVSVGLIGCSIYLAVDNMIAPKGNIFEAIILFSIGVLIGLMITISLAIGQTILTFGNIMQQQIKIQQDIRNMTNFSPEKETINSILSNIIPPGFNLESMNISIEDFDKIDRELKDSIKKTDKALKDSTNKIIDTKKLCNMNIAELEKELSNAVKKEDFERAAQINMAIKFLNESDDLEKKD